MKKLTRREFLKMLGIAGAGVVASQIPIKEMPSPVVNPAAVVTKPAMGAGTFHVLEGVYWSYSGDPVNGRLTIKDGSTTVFSMGITSAGVGFLPFMPSLRISDNSALVVTLADGGDGITGKLSLIGMFFIKHKHKDVVVWNEAMKDSGSWNKLFDKET